MHIAMYVVMHSYCLLVLFYYFDKYTSLNSRHNFVNESYIEGLLLCLQLFVCYEIITCRILYIANRSQWNTFAVR